MISFIPISILAYALSGGAILIDKILLKKSLPNPIAYTFYLSLLGGAAVIFFPLGVVFSSLGILMATISGILGVLAFYAFFQSLKVGEASVVGPVTGALNPLFSLLIGVIVFNEVLTSNQYLAFFIILLGGVVLTFNIYSQKLKNKHQLLWMIAAGFFFAVSYVLLREAYQHSNFISGLVISRIAACIFALLFLFSKNLRQKIFERKNGVKAYSGKITVFLLLLGQGLGALSGLFINFAISYANPALVNSFFGVQYLVILITSIMLFRNHPQLLDEHLTKPVIIQKLLGAVIISVGLYLIAQ